MLGLRFCAGAFSSCGKRGPLFITVHGPLTIVASHVAEHRLQTRRLSSCGSRAQCSTACGIFPDQGSNPCPLHWQADSQPLRHWGSPSILFLRFIHFHASVVCLFFSWLISIAITTTKKGKKRNLLSLAFLTISYKPTTYSTAKYIHKKSYWNARNKIIR